MHIWVVHVQNEQWHKGKAEDTDDLHKTNNQRDVIPMRLAQLFHHARTNTVLPLMRWAV